MEMTPGELAQRFPALTRDFTPEDCEALGQILVPVQVRPGEVLIEYGTPTDTMYLIQRGVLAIYVEDRGERLVLGRGGPGTAVGEIAMIDPGPASASVRAVEEARLLALSHDAFHRFRTERPEAGSAMLGAISMDLVQRLRTAGQGLLWRIGEHEWMKIEARRDREGWFRRLATLIIGMGEERP